MNPIHDILVYMIVYGIFTFTRDHFLYGFLGINVGKYSYTL